jgi:hypothetical protein
MPEPMRTGARRAARAVLGALGAVLVVGAVAAGPAAAADRQQSDMFTFADLPVLVDKGDSVLKRDARAVHAKVRTSELPPGPHTMWWIVWNNPEACGADGCNDADFGVPGVDVDIGYADGMVVRADGRGHFNAKLREGQDLPGFPPELGWTTGTGLRDAQRSEIHLVLRSHGPSIRGIVRDMVSTLHGGCDYSVFGGLVPEGSVGIPGPNTCVDMQFAVHP